MEEPTIDDTIEEVIKYAAWKTDSHYRLIISNFIVEARLSPRDGRSEETNWIFENTEFGRIDLNLQLLKHCDKTLN